MKDHITLAVIFVEIFFFTVAGGLKCRVCVDGVDDESKCHNEADCHGLELCYIDVFLESDGSLTYYKGCRAKQVCEVNNSFINKRDTNFISKLSTGESHKRNVRPGKNICTSCCDGDYCSDNHCRINNGSASDALRTMHCHSCDSVESPGDCKEFTKCADTQICYTSQRYMGGGNTSFRMGCEDKHICDLRESVASTSTNHRRRRGLHHHQGIDDENIICLTCCPYGYCNRLEDCSLGLRAPNISTLNSTTTTNTVNTNATTLSMSQITTSPSTLTTSFETSTSLPQSPGVSYTPTSAQSTHNTQTPTPFSPTGDTQTSTTVPPTGHTQISTSSTSIGYTQTLTASPPMGHTHTPTPGNTGASTTGSTRTTTAPPSAGYTQTPTTGNTQTSTSSPLTRDTHTPTTRRVTTGSTTTTTTTTTTAQVTTTQVTTPKKTASTAPTTPREGVQCYECSGPFCGFFDTSPTKCPPSTPYCLTTFIKKNGQKAQISKSCVDIPTCRTKWFDSSSDQNRCLNLNGGQIQQASDITCFYCCTSDLCNKGVVPDENTLYTIDDAK